METQPAVPGREEVERIICASRVCRDLAQYAEMERIRQGAVRRNARVGIHAALLYQSGWYVHWVEGPGPEVRELVARVARDNRHHGQVVLHHTRGPRYLLTRWSMMLNPSSESANEFGHRVEELLEARRRGIQFPPTSVFRRLAAPLRVRGPQGAGDPEGFHRVGVCSADDGRAFDLVRWLAEHKQGAAGESRRVAGEEDLDSSSDYAEFLQDGYPCRVIGVSRSNLLHGLRRAVLPDWPFLVLLFGSDAKRNMTLMQRVLQACADLPGVPQLLGVATEAAVHARMAATAWPAGLSYSPLGLLHAQDQEAVWRAVAERLRERGAPAVSQWDNSFAGWLD